MPADLKPYTGVHPYASELYGVYQPLLGWRSRRTQKRIESGFAACVNRLLTRPALLLAPRVEISPGTLHPREVRFRTEVAQESPSVSPLMKMAPQSLIVQRVLAEVRRDGEADPAVWQRYTSRDFLAHALREADDSIREAYETELRRSQGMSRVMTEDAQRSVLHSILARESVTAGALAAVGARDGGRHAVGIFGVARKNALSDALQALEGVQALADPRKSELARAVISPIGVVHLFRQYFFEFESFLGPSVEHLWLSPGGRVELVEISARRTLIERITENAFQQMARTEKSLMLEDELSEVVRLQNSSSTRFGVSVNTNASFSLGPVFTTQVTAGSSYDLASCQEEARESLHRAVRQQTEHLASEMKRSFRSTFRTTSEVTDTRSRRYVIENRTEKLMNYELRRKMRQVGVQLQDYGTYLCWQTYVDRPGDELGVADLVHIAVPNDMPPPVQPDLPPDPQPHKGDTIKHRFRWPLSDQGAFEGLGPEYFGPVIAGRFPITPSPGFKLDRVEVVIIHGDRWGFLGRGLAGSERPVGVGATETTHTTVEVLHPPNIGDSPGPRQPLTDAHPEFEFEITPFYTPSDWLLAKVGAEKEQRIQEATQAREREYQEKMYAAIRERVKLASNVQPRRFEDLREEERIIVYRNLIRQLMAETGVETAEPRVHHVFAELVQAMFDIEKMLYFVAPEWWMPTSGASPEETCGLEADADECTRYSTVGWGGGKMLRDDNYRITEDSTPAKLGSSLGWMIQLDGDNLRNAFLNAPWVKAVVPIRTGKETRAIDWLQGANVEGGDGMNAAHEASEPELQRIRDALGLPPGSVVTLRHAVDALIQRLQKRHKTARSKMKDTNGVERDWLPLDHVYEHGFDPLQGGFRIPPQADFEVFDQWLEVVPTDQIVPVEVEYDPKTGRLI